MDFALLHLMLVYPNEQFTSGLIITTLNIPALFFIGVKLEGIIT